MAMKLGRGGVLVVLVAAAAVVWWSVHTATRSVDSAGRHANTANTSAPDLPEPVAAGAPPAAKRQEEERASDAPPPAPASDDPFIRWLGDSEQGIVVEGTITVVDEKGVEHAEESGTFVPLALKDGNGGGNGNRPATVKAGRFQIHLPPGRDLSIASLVLGSRSAYVTNGRAEPKDSSSASVGSGSKPFAVVAGEPIHVMAQWPRPFLLHVVEAGSGSELRDVDVLLVRGDRPTFGVVNPGSLAKATRLVEHGVSPIELSGPRPNSTLQWHDSVWVHAPGRSWGRVRVDFEKGGEAKVELTPAADLEVSIAGAIPPPPSVQKLSFETDETIAVLRLREESNLYKLLLERTPEIPGPTRVEGLPPGRFDLSLERGSYWDRPLVLGKTTVELTIGSTTHATITVAPPREARRVPLAGTLHLSDDWECKWIDLRFEPADVKGGTSLEKRGLEFKDLEPTGVSGLYRFKLEPVLPGRYVVKSYIFSYQQIVDTGPEGRTDVALVIGDPADVLVHVLDAFTEKAYDENGLLLWNCRWPPESTGGGLMPATFEADRAAYRLKAPAGEIELHVAYGTPGRFEPLEPRFQTVQSGSNELTIRVRRSTGVVVTFEQDGRRIAPPPDAKIHVESADGTKLDPKSAPDLLGPLRHDDGLLLRVPRAGPWRLTFDPPAGFEPIAPIDVTLTTGELATTTVALHPVK